MVEGAPGGAVAVTAAPDDPTRREWVWVRTRRPGSSDPADLVWHRLQGTGHVVDDLPESELLWTAWPQLEPWRRLPEAEKKRLGLNRRERAEEPLPAGTAGPGHTAACRCSVSRGMGLGAHAEWCPDHPDNVPITDDGSTSP